MIFGFSNFLKDVFSDRKLIISMAINDFRLKNAGTFFGILWSFVQPLMTICVMWFVFEVGFRSSPVDNIPFIIWFIPAYVAWIYFSDILISSSNCLYEYNYLVKKVKFRLSILPIVKILSASFVHLFFIVFTVLILYLYGYDFHIIYFQVFYYMFCLMFFSLGLSWLLSAISVFFKDISQIINVFLQIGFWITPIFWNPDKMIPSISLILKLNPIYYIIRGYRDTFVDHIPFWQRLGTSVYFWIISILTFFAGAYIFKKLRGYFADEM